MAKQELNLADIRREYGALGLTEKEMLASPFLQFKRWFSDALANEQDDPTAMVLSTVDASGFPNARVVLLKEITTESFVFYTHYNSVKGQEIALNPQVALTFYWPKQSRQLRIRGHVSRISESESDAYFVSRPLLSQISALASHQSRRVLDRETLEKNYQSLLKEYENKSPTRPKQWGGFAVMPISFEFWQGRNSRLHDRIEYTKQDEHWVKARLEP